MRRETDRVIREAEASKAKIFRTPGNDFENFMQQNYEGMLNANNPNPNNYVQTSLVDDRYMVIGAYVDSGLQEKIKRGGTFCSIVTEI